MPGRPFAKPTAADRARLDAQIKQDLNSLGGDLFKATVAHLNANPESVVTQAIVSVEEDTGAITAIARGLRTLARERAAAKVGGGG